MKMKMKKLVLGLVLLVSTLSFGQVEKIELSGSDVFLTLNFQYQNPNDITWNPYGSYKTSILRLGPSAKSSLIQAISKAIEWSKLNKTHKRDFVKVICTFKVMDKDTYQRFGYSNNFSREMIVEFKGYSNGSFDLYLKTKERIKSSYIPVEMSISINTINELENFKKYLNSKNINKEIDEIFK